MMSLGGSDPLAVHLGGTFAQNGGSLPPTQGFSCDQFSLWDSPIRLVLLALLSSSAERKASFCTERFVQPSVLFFAAESSWVVG